MKKYLKNLLFFSMPLIIIFAYIEISLRNNSFDKKVKYINKNKNNIELIFFGSSHNWRAINPEYLDFITAPLASGGSALNIDYLLFQKYKFSFPKLKFVIIELSYPNLEEARINWSKNHLLWIYFKINSNTSKISLKDNFLLTSNFPVYFKKFIFQQNKIPAHPELRNESNQYGYLKINENKKGNGKTFYKPHILKQRHQKENIVFYKINKKYLTEIINFYISQDITVILLSPPKYYTYNQIMNKNKLLRRNNFVKTKTKTKKCIFWNYENTYENRIELFGNEDHLNSYGARFFTKELNRRLKKINKPY